MTKMNIKKGDTVLAIAGKDNGKIATVLECFPEQNKVTVKGLNMVVKHNKPKSAQDKGGIVKKEGMIDASDVMVICPSCNKATKIKFGNNEKGKKVRLCKKCGASLDSGAKKPTTTKKTTAPAQKDEKSTAESVENKKTVKKTATTAKKTTASVVKKDSQKHETKSAVKTVRNTAVRKASSPAKKIGGK